MHQYNKILDSACLLELYDDDLDHVLQMFEIYVDIIENQIEDLLDAVITENRELVRKLSHKIKPVFTMVGLPAYSTICKDIEQESMLSDIKELKTKADTLKTKIIETLPAIKAEIQTIKQKNS